MYNFTLPDKIAQISVDFVMEHPYKEFEFYTDLPKTSGVYFLVILLNTGPKVIYVGSTHDFRQRFAKHKFDERLKLINEVSGPIRIY